MKVYSLVRKVKKTQWIPCVIYDEGRLIKGGRTPDKNIVETYLKGVQKDFPKEKYAILEIEK